MLSSEAKEILRLLQIRKVDKNPSKFFESSLEETSMFNNDIMFNLLLEEMVRLKFVRIDENGNYSITNKGKIVFKDGTKLIENPFGSRPIPAPDKKEINKPSYAQNMTVTKWQKFRDSKMWNFVVAIITIAAFVILVMQVLKLL